MKQALNEKEILRAHYLKSPASRKFPNKVNPFRNENQLWQSFLESTVKKNLGEERFIKSGLFQAICNLCWGGELDDWTLIKHVAALEGLCKVENETIFPKPRYREIKHSIIEGISAIGKDSELKNLNSLKKNIESNHRIINGRSFKWHVENRFNKLGINAYYKKHSNAINAAIDLRNVVAHEGWAREWKIDISEHVKIIRNSIYLLIVSMLEHQGEFYFFGENSKTNLKCHATEVKADF